jgi:hypothetical protein
MAPRNSRDALLEKRRKIEAQLKALDARDREQQRKDDTRRKIIIGGLVMAEMESDADLRAAVRRLIEEKAGDKDRDFLAEWLASVAATPLEDAAGSRQAQAPTAAPPVPQETPHTAAREAPAKSSLILPGQGGTADRPPSKPSIILRP